MSHPCPHHLDPLKSRRDFVLQSAACGAALLLPATATAGIRGTGVYLEASPERTYFCTNHIDDELVMLDKRVGRKPPLVKP